MGKRSWVQILMMVVGLILLAGCSSEQVGCPESSKGHDGYLSYLQAFQAVSSPTSEGTIGQVWYSPIDGMPLLPVPEGEFRMGASEEDKRAYSYEKPLHLVYLDPYWVDMIEVTNAMYAECVADGACEEPRDRDGFQRKEYFTSEACSNYPVVNVTWEDAKQYCEWAGRRLPTEAEWEKAARGTDGRIFPWGDQDPTGELTNFCDANCPSDERARSVDDGYESTSPVGTYPLGASPYGPLDLAGNVWEWVQDWSYGSYYAESPLDNPQGPATGRSKVTRGGSWVNFPSEIRTSNRNAGPPGNFGWATGFRCVRDVE